MKGYEKLISTLNSLLADELTAVNQYVVHAEVVENWGYGKLHAHFRKRAFDEMKHAEKLIGRIIFLEGIPVVSEYRKINIGQEVPKQLEYDYTTEMTAIRSYNEAIEISADAGDFATREILETILQDEDRHVNDIEALQDQIHHMGLPLFLSMQVKE